MPLQINGTTLDKLYINGSEMDKGYINGTEVHSGFTPTHTLTVASSSIYIGLDTTWFGGTLTPSTLAGYNFPKLSFNTSDNNYNWNYVNATGNANVKLTLENGLTMTAYTNNNWTAGANTSIVSYLNSNIGNTVPIILEIV